MCQEGRHWALKEGETMVEGQHHTHIHTCMYAYKDSHVYISIYIYRYIWIYIYILSCIHTHKNLPKSTIIYETLHMNGPSFIDCLYYM